jgi:16S rRNA (guanine(966)-N(2))-methyltransferase RsmD
MRTRLRIVAGSLRGRKLACSVNPRLRPAPEMVRQALFSILGDAVPGRPFFDLFAGTGAVGLEALSRGARMVSLVERDLRTAAEIERNLRDFRVSDRAAVVRADVYRWVQRWHPGDGPVNLFLGPPYPDYQRRLEDLLGLIGELQARVADGSVIVVQSERLPEGTSLPDASRWDERRYGRNHLWFWVKGPAADADAAAQP